MAFGIITGAVAGGLASLLAGERANRANAENVARQIDFQDAMSRTQYQRAVEDMKKAGLNPMLAYSQGGNASPSGAAAVNQPVDVGPAVQNAIQARLAGAQVKNVEAQTRKTEVETAVAAAEVPRVQAEARVAASSALQSERGLEDRLAMLGFDVDSKAYDMLYKRWKYGGWEGSDDDHARLKELAIAEYRGELGDRKWQEARAPEWIKRLPLETRKMLAEALLSEYGVPGARREAEVWESGYGALRPYVKDGAWGGGGVASAAMAARQAREVARSAKRGSKERREPQKPGESRLRVPDNVEPFMF